MTLQKGENHNNWKKNNHLFLISTGKASKTTKLKKIVVV